MSARRTPILAQAASSRDKDEIVRECLRLDNLPAIPPYWRRMRAQNMSGVAALGQPAEPPALTVDECTEQQHAGVLVLDTWPRRHSAVPTCRALNVGLAPAFATWAGTVLPDQAGVVLVLDRPDDLWQASWQLLRIGPPPDGLAGHRDEWLAHLGPPGTQHSADHGARTQAAPGPGRDHPAGRSTAQRVPCWARRRCPLPHGCPTARADRRAARHPITGGDLQQRIPLVGGGRLLAHHGHAGVVNVIGGMTAWTNAAYPIEQ